MVKFIKNWNFWCQDCSFTPMQVLDWIASAQIPNNVSFTPLYNPPSLAWIENDPKYGTYPLPQKPGTIVVISGTAVSGFGGMSGGETWGCLVTALPGESSDTLGARIWHEMLHGMGVNSDGLMSPPPNDNDEFYDYITNNAERYAAHMQDILYMYQHPDLQVPTSILMIYYTMLWEKYGFDKL